MAPSLAWVGKPPSRSMNSAAVADNTAAATSTSVMPTTTTAATATATATAADLGVAVHPASTPNPKQRSNSNANSHNKGNDETAKKTYTIAVTTLVGKLSYSSSRRRMCYSYFSRRYIRRHILWGNWSYSTCHNALTPPQRFELIRIIPAGETWEDLPKDGVFEGRFNVGDRVIVESGVKLSFKKKGKEGEFSVNGTGANELGMFELFGSVKKNRDEEGVDPTYKVSLQKQYYEYVAAPPAPVVPAAKKSGEGGKDKKSNAIKKFSSNASRQDGSRKLDAKLIKPLSVASPVANTDQRKGPPPSSPNPTAMVPSKGVANELLSTESASNNNSHNHPMTEEEKKEKERFLLFVRLLMEYLEQRDTEMHATAKAQIEECYEKNKAGHPEFKSLTNALKPRLRATVGEVYWKKAHDHLAHFLKQRSESESGQQAPHLAREYPPPLRSATCTVAAAVTAAQTLASGSPAAAAADPGVTVHSVLTIKKHSNANSGIKGNDDTAKYTSPDDATKKKEALPALGSKKGKAKDKKTKNSRKRNVNTEESRISKTDLEPLNKSMGSMLDSVLVHAAKMVKDKSKEKTEPRNMQPCTSKEGCENQDQGQQKNATIGHQANPAMMSSFNDGDSRSSRNTQIRSNKSTQRADKELAKDVKGSSTEERGHKRKAGDDMNALKKSKRTTLKAVPTKPTAEKSEKSSPSSASSPPNHDETVARNMKRGQTSFPFYRLSLNKDSATDSKGDANKAEMNVLMKSKPKEHELAPIDSAKGKEIRGTENKGIPSSSANKAVAVAKKSQQKNVGGHNEGAKQSLHVPESIGLIVHGPVGTSCSSDLGNIKNVKSNSRHSQEDQSSSKLSSHVSDEEMSVGEEAFKACRYLADVSPGNPYSLHKKIKEKSESADEEEKKFYHHIDNYIFEKGPLLLAFDMDKIQGIAGRFEFYMEKLVLARSQHNERDISYYDRFIEYYIAQIKEQFPLTGNLL